MSDTLISAEVRVVDWPALAAEAEQHPERADRLTVSAALLELGVEARSVALAHPGGPETHALVLGGRLDARGLHVGEAQGSDAYVLVAHDEDGARRAFLVDASAPGLDRRGTQLSLDGVEPITALPGWSDEQVLGTSALLQAAATLGSVSTVLEDAAEYVRERGRPWPGRSYARLLHDPHVIRGFGQAQARLQAARAAVAAAVDSRVVGRAESIVSALIARAETADAATAIVAALPDLLGPGAPEQAPLWTAFERIRRNTGRDSAAWRQHAVGQHVLSSGWTDPDRPRSAPDVVPPDGVVRRIVSAADAISVARAYSLAIAEEAGERDRERRHAFAELELLRRTGLLGITVPVEYGGLGAAWATVAEVVRIVGSADGSISQILQPHFGALEAILTAGTEPQRRFFFAQALAGARFGSANGERGTKAAGDITTRLVPTLTGTYRVEGTKFYCTGSLSADWTLVTARDPSGNRCSALVRRDAPGLELVDDWSGIGQRTTASGTTRLHGVEVDELHVLATWRMAEGAHLSGAKANLVHAAVNVGIGFGALAAGREYILTRSRPSKDLGLESVLEDPHLVQRFGLLHGRLQAASGLLARAAAVIDAAALHPTPETNSAATLAVAAAEAYGGDVALQIAGEVFALAGASASRAEVGLDRHWRDVRTHTLHDHAVWKYHQLGDALLTGAQYFGNRRNVI